MVVSGLSIIEIRIIPYPPSFRSTAASTIEPAIGASTWAFGSQRWRPYNGILTMKAKIHANHKRELAQLFVSGLIQYCIRRKFREPMLFCIYVRATNKGRDPTSV